MDKNNPVYVEGYPEYKKMLWGAFRAFVAGFLSALATFLLTVNEENLLDKDWWLRIVLTGSLVGGIIALGKWLRDMFPESSLMQRIPI